jgi:hypothetical protein
MIKSEITISNVFLIDAHLEVCHDLVFGMLTYRVESLELGTI